MEVDGPVVGLLLVASVRPIHDYLDSLESDQSPANHFVELGKYGLDLLLGFDAFHNQREIER